MAVKTQESSPEEGEVFYWQQDLRVLMEKDEQKQGDDQVQQVPEHEDKQSNEGKDSIKDTEEKPGNVLDTHDQEQVLVHENQLDGPEDANESPQSPDLDQDENAVCQQQPTEDVVVITGSDFVITRDPSSQIPVKASVLENQDLEGQIHPEIAKGCQEQGIEEASRQNEKEEFEIYQETYDEPVPKIDAQEMEQDLVDQQKGNIGSQQLPKPDPQPQGNEKGQQSKEDMVIAAEPDLALEGEASSSVPLHAAELEKDDKGSGSQIDIEIAKGCRSGPEQGIYEAYERKETRTREEMEKIEPPTSDDTRNEIYSKMHLIIQGDTSHYFKLPVDIKTKVPF